jgi:hypothetical protein
MAKKKFILKSVGSCKSCNIEVINTDSFVIFADRTCQHTTCYEQSETTRQNNLKEPVDKIARSMLNIKLRISINIKQSI